jgi:hypothetical protein
MKKLEKIKKEQVELNNNALSKIIAGANGDVETQFISTTHTANYTDTETSTWTCCCDKAVISSR